MTFCAICGSPHRGKCPVADLNASQELYQDYLAACKRMGVPPMSMETFKQRNAAQVH